MCEPDDQFPPTPFPPSGTGHPSGLPPQPDCQAFDTYKATWVDLTGLRCPHCGAHIGVGSD